MKKDTLQDRRLYTCRYSYDGVGYHIIRVGGNRYDYFTAKLRALVLFRKMYPDRELTTANIIVE